MKVMITGGCGHIGSRLIGSLPEHEIVVVDNMITQRYVSLFRLPDNIKFIEKHFIHIPTDYLKEFDVVIHLAAVTDTTNGDPIEIEENNIFHTQNFIIKCEDAGVSKFIFPSSTSVYGVAAEKVWEDPRFISPQSPYAEAKYTIENALIENCTNMEYLILRFGTIFGTSPGMRFHTAINKFCWQASIGESLTVCRENFDLVRPYLGLGDAVRCIKHFFNRPQYFGGIFNILSGNYKTSEILSMIKQHVDIKINMVDTPLLNQYSYEVSAERAGITGFHPKSNIERGIEQTLDLLRGLR
jgi:UDP-glucose 4-epimerase